MGLVAIGDVHGCLRTLDLLLDSVALQADDHLVFLGDYIDRGPDSRGVIDRCQKLALTQQCTFLRGNHEAYMLEYLRSGKSWDEYGGRVTLRNYACASGDIHIPEGHVTFLQQTRLYLDTPSFLFVHAGLQPNYTVAQNLAVCDEETLLWIRTHLSFPEKELAWEKTVVCGHTPFPSPVNRPRLICIDTGCVWNTRPELGRLTAVRLPERVFISVPNVDV